MIEKLEAFFASLSTPWGYVFLSLSSFIENIFPPLPGDTFVVLGAFLVGRGHMAFAPTYAATLVGSVLGFMTYYAVGRKWGRGWIEGRRRSRMHERLEQVERWFARYGAWVIVFNRFLSGFRSVVSFTAGVAGMNPRTVAPLAVLSCAIWNALLMALGLWVGENWGTVVRNLQRIVFVAVLAAAAVLWFRAWRNRKRLNAVQKRTSAEE